MVPTYPGGREEKGLGPWFPAAAWLRPALPVMVIWAGPSRWKKALSVYTFAFQIMNES